MMKLEFLPEGSTPTLEIDGSDFYRLIDQADRVFLACYDTGHVKLPRWSRCLYPVTPLSKTVRLSSRTLISCSRGVSLFCSCVLAEENL